ncbi:MAG: YebC/PmpR family DNA-binding transcriptional regulator [Thermoanaerobaculia bacterium]
MAGHSKWAQIKRKKAVTDARRGRLWSKLLKEISVAARLSGGDPAANPRLRAAIQDAKGANVPNDNIDRAIKRGTGELQGASYEEVTYEGYGPGGVAILVQALTDNRNRTVSELRHFFSKHGGNLGENGCVAWMFEKRGYFAIDKQALGEEQFMELALELGAADFSIEEGTFEIYTLPEDYEAVRNELERRELPLVEAELAMLPQSQVKLDEKTAPRVLRLMEALEEHDDVQHVWANFDVDSEVLAAHSG